MTQFRFRALLWLDPPPPDSQPDGRYPSGTRHLLVHAWGLRDPAQGKYMEAMIVTDGDVPLEPGTATVATISVHDDQALDYLGPGHRFTLWGQGAGRGIISRRVFTGQGPS